MASGSVVKKVLKNIELPVLKKVRILGVWCINALIMVVLSAKKVLILGNQCL